MSFSSSVPSFICLFVCMSFHQLPGFPAWLSFYPCQSIPLYAWFSSLRLHACAPVRPSFRLSVSRLYVWKDVCSSFLQTGFKTIDLSYWAFVSNFVKDQVVRHITHTSLRTHIPLNSSLNSIVYFRKTRVYFQSKTKTPVNIMYNRLLFTSTHALRDWI